MHNVIWIFHHATARMSSFNSKIICIAENCAHHIPMSSNLINLKSHLWLWTIWSILRQHCEVLKGIMILLTFWLTRILSWAMANQMVSTTHIRHGSKTFHFELKYRRLCYYTNMKIVSLPHFWHTNNTSSHHGNIPFSLYFRLGEKYCPTWCCRSSCREMNRPTTVTMATRMLYWNLMSCFIGIWMWHLLGEVSLLRKTKDDYH